MLFLGCEQWPRMRDSIPESLHRTALKVQVVLARAAFCLIWFPLWAVKAAKWSEELRLNSAFKPFLFLPIKLTWMWPLFFVASWACPISERRYIGFSVERILKLCSRSIFRGCLRKRRDFSLATLTRAFDLKVFFIKLWNHHPVREVRAGACLSILTLFKVVGSIILIISSVKCGQPLNLQERALAVVSTLQHRLLRQKKEGV